MTDNGFRAWMDKILDDEGPMPPFQQGELEEAYNAGFEAGRLAALDELTPRLCGCCKG